jgi:hypothetical protein
VISISVLGTPAPKGSSRAFYKAGMKRAVIVKDNSERQRGWDRNVRETALETLGPCLSPVFVQKPLQVELQFRITRPAGHWRSDGMRLKPSAPIAPAGKPDIDKLARSTLDALIGLAFDDDSRIVRLMLSKAYAAPGHEGCLITVAAYDPDVVVALAKHDDVKHRDEVSHG